MSDGKAFHTSLGNSYHVWFFYQMERPCAPVYEWIFLGKGQEWREIVELLLFHFWGLLQVRRRCSILPFMEELLLPDILLIMVLIH
jgi:hypothetical protein